MHDAVLAVAGAVLVAVTAAVPWWVGDATAWAGLVVALAAASAVIWRLAVRAARQAEEMVDRVVLRHVAPLAGNLGELTQRVRTIEATVQPNGGSTLRDAVDRIEEHITHRED